MDFMILDSAGNAVEAFATEHEAVSALAAMAENEPKVAQHLAVLAFDDAGEAVGEPLTVADVRPEAATTLTVSGEFLTRAGSLTVLAQWTDAFRTPPKVAGAL